MFGCEGLFMGHNFIAILSGEGEFCLNFFFFCFQEASCPHFVVRKWIDLIGHGVHNRHTLCRILSSGSSCFRPLDHSLFKFCY